MSKYSGYFYYTLRNFLQIILAELCVAYFFIDKITLSIRFRNYGVCGLGSTTNNTTASNPAIIV